MKEKVFFIIFEILPFGKILKNSWYKLEVKTLSWKSEQEKLNFQPTL